MKLINRIFSAAVLFCLCQAVPEDVEAQRIYPSAEALSPVETDYKSFSASRSKCGFAPFTGDTSPAATRYRTLTETEQAFSHVYDLGFVGFGGFSYGPALASPGTFAWAVTCTWTNSTSANVDYRKYNGSGDSDILATHSLYSGAVNTGSSADSYSTNFSAYLTREPLMT